MKLGNCFRPKSKSWCRKFHSKLFFQRCSS